MPTSAARHKEVDCATPSHVPHETPIGILSVEDHPVFRQGLARVIGTEPDMVLVAQAGNGIEAIAEFHRHPPDITLMDRGCRVAMAPMS